MSIFITQVQRAARYHLLIMALLEQIKKNDSMHGLNIALDQLSRPTKILAEMSNVQPDIGKLHENKRKNRAYRLTPSSKLISEKRGLQPI